MYLAADCSTDLVAYQARDSFKKDKDYNGENNNNNNDNNNNNNNNDNNNTNTNDNNNNNNNNCDSRRTATRILQRLTAAVAQLPGSSEWCR